MSTSGGVWTALERAASVGCDSCQLFVKNNMQWSGRAFTASELARYRAARSATRLRAVFGHTGYLINLAAPPSPNRDRSMESLIQEIELASGLELPFLVLHPGAHLGAGEVVGLTRVAQALDEVFRSTRRSAVRVALENTAGQGTCLGATMDHLATVFDQVRHPERLAVCLDTAHLFAAGHDIRTPRGWDQALDKVESTVGLKRVVALHLNDSKTELGSRVDRHAGIGLGQIGREAFRHIVNDARFAEHPGCLETPKGEDLKEDVQNLAILRALVGRKPRRKAGALFPPGPPSPTASRPRRSPSPRQRRSSAQPFPKAT